MDPEGISPGRRVRSTNDGQIGYLQELEDGTLGVRLDRRGEQRVVPFRAPEWEPDSEPQLTPIQLARLVYDIDRALRIATGSYANTIKEWISLRDQERTAWLNRARWQPVLDQLRKYLGI